MTTTKKVMKKILYLHGFASSGASGTVDLGGHRLNAHVVTHTLLPYIKALGIF